MAPDLIQDETSEQPPASPADIRLAAMNYLARREHTKKELLQKLKRRFSDMALLRAEIQRLADENLQSDKRFAESFVHYRSGLGFGLLRIRQDMRQRGLSDFEIYLAVDTVGVNWRAVALAVYRKKFGAAPPVDMREKARRFRFMQYRGFVSDEYRHLA